MARPQKEGLDYFPMNVDIENDDKIELIEAAHGITGFGIIVKILCKIYREGYFYKWGEKEQLLFSKRVNVDINKVNAIIDDCLRWQLFDLNLWQTWNILTSCGIQKRYFEACKRRKSVSVIEPYLLINITDYLKDNVTITRINVDNNRQSARALKESKVKDIKGKEKKEEKKPPKPPTRDFELPDWVDPELWEGLMAVRKKKKAADTPLALKILLNKLTKLRDAGDDPGELLKNSIANSWKSVFPLNKNGKPRQGELEYERHARESGQYDNIGELPETEV